MALDMISLLQARGATATAGQSFRNDGDDAPLPTGADMLEYVLDDPDWSGITLLTPAEHTYPSGSVINGTVEFPTMGSRFQDIYNPIGWQDISTADIVMGASTWDFVAKDVDLSFTLEGEFDATTIPTITSFTQAFEGGQTITDNGPLWVQTSVTYGGGGGASGTDDRDVQLRFSPDAGGFNPVVDSPVWPVRISRQAYPPGSSYFEVQYYENSGYTGSTVSGRFLSTDSTFEYDIWARYRPVSGGAWTNYGQIHWSDTRPDV